MIPWENTSVLLFSGLEEDYSLGGGTSSAAEGSLECDGIGLDGESSAEVRALSSPNVGCGKNIPSVPDIKEK